MRLSLLSPLLSPLLALLLSGLSSIATAAEVSGTRQPWHAVTLDFAGPQASEQDAVSPFVAYQLDVAFVHEGSGQRLVVPGFFAADGNAADTSAEAGSVWRARFCPPLPGTWRYAAAMTRDGEAIELTGHDGSFVVEPLDSDESFSRDFRRRGGLRYVGERYLRTAVDDRPFLLAGTNSPETLLGYADFDGTWHDTQKHDPPAPHDPIRLPSLENGLHRYADHVADWAEGDPTWKDGKGKALVGAVNYLADVGVNSAYMLTMNVNGDGRNVWPWTDPMAHDRFDVSKLAQWDRVFDHMQSRGLVLHLVLQETENDHLLDNGDLGPDRKRYLRELVARFAHHPAILWNLGEENLQSPAQRAAMAAEIRRLDAYDHPIVLHNDHYAASNIRDTFDPHLGEATLDGTTIQNFHWNDVHADVRHYTAASRKAGKPWVIFTTEMGGAQFGLPTDADQPDHAEPRGKGLWGQLLAGGGGVEWYFGWQNNSPHSDLSAESFRPREAMYRQSRLAIDFLRTHLPLDRPGDLRAANGLTHSATDYCLAEPGQVYAIYLPDGAPTRLDLQDHDGVFSVAWFNPRSGGPLRAGSVETVTGPGLVGTGTPPREATKPDGTANDWVCLVRRIDPVFASIAAEGGHRFVIDADRYARQSRDDLRRWVTLRKLGELPDVEGAGDARTWTQGILSASKTASDGVFLRLLPDTRRTHDDKLIRGENFSPQPGRMAILSYPITVAEAGRYYVWVRAFSTGTEDNGLHVGIDGQWPESGQRMQWCEGKRRWTWGCAQRTEANHCGEPMAIFLDLEPGRHELQLSMREDGFAIDQILLTTDREYRPDGVQRPSPIRASSPTD